MVPYGDAAALEAAIDEDTVAFLVEPIQGEAGVVVPPEGYLRRARELCTERNVLLVADEIQTGLGRTGTTFACEHDGVRPDVFILGKALAGGIVPLSAVVADEEILGVYKPGEHGSTFGGNPVACAIGRRVVAMLRTGEFQEASTPARRVPAFGAAGREPRRPSRRSAAAVCGPGSSSSRPRDRRGGRRSGCSRRGSSRRTRTRARCGSRRRS